MIPVWIWNLKKVRSGEAHADFQPSTWYRKPGTVGNQPVRSGCRRDPETPHYRHQAEGLEETGPGIRRKSRRVVSQA